jgi:hypothetical protein
MSTPHNDLKWLIEFSIEHSLESALASFPMTAGFNTVAQL